MLEVSWTPGLVVLGLGLLAGLVLALSTRRTTPTPDTDREAHLEDLRQRKDSLLRQLRDHAGDDSVQAVVERRRLEDEAARVLRELDALDRGEASPDATSAAPAPGAKAPAAAPAAPAGGLPPALQGALYGGGGVGLVALVLFGLQSNTTESFSGMDAGGGGSFEMADPADFGVAPAPPPPPAPAVDPVALDAARARVAANPKDIAARNELGWLLIEGEAWVDGFGVAEDTLALDDDDPDALTILAIVRLAMGQTQAAEDLLHKALTSDPRHARATGTLGMAFFQQERYDDAITWWQKAAEIHGPGGGFEDLIATARLRAGGTPAQQQSAQAAADDPRSVRGVIRLAPGAQPAGSTLFLIARPVGQQRGAPAATRRLQVSSFPVEFELGPQHTMNGAAFPESMTLSARLDGDGNAMTREPTDLSGAVADPVAPGAQGLEIVLSP